MVHDMFNLIKCKEWYRLKSVVIPQSAMEKKGKWTAMQQVLSGKLPKDS